MFENLEEARRGPRTKERTRLWLTVAACLVVGTAIYGGQSGCAGDGERTQPAEVARRQAEKPKPTVELDRTPLLALAERGGASAEFDAKALEYVVSQVLRGEIARDPWRTLTPSEVLALDPREATGRTIEVQGRVRTLDREERELGGKNLLWAFALEGEDGAKIVLVQPGTTQSLGEDHPRAAYPPKVGPPLDEGDLVQARGIYLQRRTGSIARVSLEAPTPVLVGREYRITFPPGPPIASPSQAALDTVEDRFQQDMRDPQTEASWQILRWAQATGHEEIVKRLGTDALPVRSWARDQFWLWRKEMSAELDKDAPDRRTWTAAQRGRVFSTTGTVAEFAKEEWDTIPPNHQAVSRRWKLWLLSDYEGYISLLFDSPFPVTAFPGVTGRPWQRVKVTGVFVQSYSYWVSNKSASPSGGPRSAAVKEGEVQSPYFVLLDVEPIPMPSTPLLENPFFWTWVSLAVFGLTFFVVLGRVEKKETAAMQAQHLRIKRRQRELERGPGATGEPPPPGSAEPPASPGDPPGPPPPP